MTVIAHPLPTLQTRAMDPLSSTHRGITPMGATRGYERDIVTAPVFRAALCSHSSVSNGFFSSRRMVTNKTINGEPVRDPEECREAALRQYDPEKAFS